MARNSSARAALTAAAASRSLTDSARASSSAKETSGLRCCAGAVERLELLVGRRHVGVGIALGHPTVLADDLDQEVAGPVVV